MTEESLTQHRAIQNKAKAARKAAAARDKTLSAAIDKAAANARTAKTKRAALGNDAARQQRIKQLGFHDSTFYHGTDAHFDEFKLSKGGQTSGSRVGSVGVSISPSRDVADEFAKLAASKTGAQPKVMELRARFGKVASLTLTGAEKNLEVAATLDDAFRGGYNSVVLKNYTTPSGTKGQTVLVVKDPAQLRRTTAKFDPKALNSRNLNAGLVIAAPLVAAAIAYDATRSRAMAAGKSSGDATRSAAGAAAVAGGGAAAVTAGIVGGIKVAAKYAPIAGRIASRAALPITAALAAYEAVAGGISGYRKTGTIAGAATGAGMGFADFATFGAASYVANRNAASTTKPMASGKRAAIKSIAKKRATNRIGRAKQAKKSDGVRDAYTNKHGTFVAAKPLTAKQRRPRRTAR